MLTGKTKEQDRVAIERNLKRGEVVHLHRGQTVPKPSEGEPP